MLLPIRIPSTGTNVGILYSLQSILKANKKTVLRMSPRGNKRRTVKEHFADNKNYRY